MNNILSVNNSANLLNMVLKKKSDGISLTSQYMMFVCILKPLMLLL